MNRCTEASAAKRLEMKRIIERDYYLLKEIGEGGFSSVRLCRSKANGSQYACKTIPKNRGALDDEEDNDFEASVHREVDIMQHLSGHPGVVNLHAAYEDSQSFHLIMELVSGGDLFQQMIKEWPCSERWSALTFKELMLIIRYCHDMGVIHRDIKPENLLITADGALKLADFGFATRFSKGQSFSSTLGSSNYVAPEVLAGNYSEKADIWSAGIMLHGMLLGALPFERDSSTQILEVVENEDLSFDSEEWESISAPARDLIRGMLNRDASLRLSAEEVLAHPWILLHTSECVDHTGSPSCLFGSVSGEEPVGM